jgi:hypothetical protein
MHVSRVVPGIVGLSTTYLTTQGGIGFGSLYPGNHIKGMPGPANIKRTAKLILCPNQATLKLIIM